MAEYSCVNAEDTSRFALISCVAKNTLTRFTHERVSSKRTVLWRPQRFSSILSRFRVLGEEVTTFREVPMRALLALD